MVSKFNNSLKVDYPKSRVRRIILYLVEKTGYGRLVLRYERRLEKSKLDDFEMSSLTDSF